MGATTGIRIDAQTSASATPPSKSKYRPEIDGLRAFAVVAVIINHFNKNLLPSGYLGVDIFFVISGYVITSSLSGSESKNLFDFVSAFYERRIKRILPALIAYVLITSVLISLFNPDPTRFLETGAEALFGRSNISLYNRSTDYFSESTELNPFTHTWSLGVEEQFYLLFPFMIWLSGFGRKSKNGARNLFLWIGALTIGSLINFIFLYQVNQPAAYFLIPSRFWEMATGCLIFIGFDRCSRLEKAFERLHPLVIVATMAGVMLVPVTASVPATIGIVVLSSMLLACLKESTAAFQFFTNPKVVYVGLISYSLYLWHWGVISISRWTIGVHWWSVPFQITLIVGLAVASHRWIETPFRKHKARNTFRLFGYGAIAVTTSYAVALIIAKYHNRVFLGSSTNARILYTRNSVSKAQSNRECDFREPNTFDANKVLAGKCNFKNQFQRKLNKNLNAQSFYFVGSSHAGTLSGLIGKLSEKTKANLFSLYVGATFFPALSPESFPDKYKESPQKYNAIQQRIEIFIEENSNPGDVVVISNHLELFGNHSSPLEKSHRQMIEIYFGNLERFTSKMLQKKVKVVLFGPMPNFSEIKQLEKANTEECSIEWFRPYPTSTYCLQSTSRDALIKSNTFLNNNAKRR